MIIEQLNRRLVTTRTVHTTIARMQANIHADIVAFAASDMKSGGIGNLGYREGIAVDADGRLTSSPIAFGSFDPDSTPEYGGVQWWNPDDSDDWVPPSALKYQKQSPYYGQPPKMAALPMGTVGGAGTGKAVPAGSAYKTITEFAAKVTVKLTRKCQNIGGYKGWIAEKAVKRIAGRACGLALTSLAGNVLKPDRRLDGLHRISTRTWTSGKTVGRKNGYAAYYRPRGRPSLPAWEAIHREEARAAARLKGTGKKHKHKKPPRPVYRTKYPRPTMKAWKKLSDSKAERAVLTAKLINHKSGGLDQFAKSTWEKLRDKHPDEIAQEVGQKVGKHLVGEARDTFFKWVKKGMEGTKPNGVRGQQSFNPATFI